MKKMKNLLTLLLLVTMTLSCSIDRIDQIASVPINTIKIVYVEGNPSGHWVYFLTDGEVTNEVFISNGIDGIDGIDGVNGLDGIDGQDGASVTITTEETDGGTILIITQNGTITTIFIADGINGTNGTDGIDGIDGTNGTDGLSVTITTEEIEGGHILTITQGNDTTSIFIAD